MFDRIIAFLKDMPTGGSGAGDPSPGDDPRVAAAALMYHLMDADGVRQDSEWEKMKAALAVTYGISGAALDRVIEQGAEADANAVDLYAFTSVVKRHLDEEARIEFIRLMWEIVFADGELHELEDHTLWRVAELIGVDRRDRIRLRREVQGTVPGAKGTSSEED
jgi:uncharacterized tellurite resistance protein B-like protein